MRDGKNYEVRYAGGLNKRPFHHPNATKPFWISTVFKAGPRCHRFCLSPSRIYVKVDKNLKGCKQ
jgi:hypothetical protein